MLAGDPDRRTQNNSDQTNQAILYETGNSGEMYGFPPTLAGDLQLNVRFPSCWDGVNVDSPDHKSHMSYPDPNKGNTEGGMCPESHPVALISIGAEFAFNTGSLGIVDSSTLVFSQGDTTGYGGHGDFLQGWQNLTALGNSFDNCTGIGADCAWNSFGTPNGEQGTKNNFSPQIPAPDENIGLNGPISALPGDNTVYTAGVNGTVATATSAAAGVAAASSPADVVSQTEVVNDVSAPATTPATTPTLTIAAPTTFQTVFVTQTVTSVVTPSGGSCQWVVG